MAKPKTPIEEKQRAEILQLREVITAQEGALEEQGERIRGLMKAIDAATATPARKFRTRTYEHGPLKITIKPVDEIGNDEVVIRHIDESLIVLVGEAARAARSGDYEEITPSVRVHIPVGDETRPEPAIEAAEVRATGRKLTKAAITAMQKATDVSQAILIGAQYGLDAESAAALAIGVDDLTTGLLPIELEQGPPNVVLQPQTDPKKPGGFQDRSEQNAVSARFGGYTGQGKRPEGWVDPDAVPKKEQTAN